MPAERARRLAGTAVAIAAVAVIAWGVFVDRAPTTADRVEALGQRLRCPVCQSESIAASTSQTARELRALITEQVEQGLGDDEIEGYFVARYGEWVLLDPPARGRNVWLWALPLLGGAAGLSAIVGLRLASRRRAALAGAASARRAAPGVRPDRPSGPAGFDPRRLKLEERRAQAAADLADLDAQHGAGEIDDQTRARLAAVYEAEADAAQRGLADLGPPDAPGRSRWRAAVGAGAFALAAVVVVAGVVLALEDRPEGGFVTGGIAADPGRDLDSVPSEEMEAIVAANPDVVGMRMALARRYVDAGEFDRALDHLLTVLEQGPPNAEAMAYVGWISYLGGETDLGVRYLERSLEVEADRPEALWFLALASMEGLDDPAAAVPLLERLLANPDLAGEQRALVADTLATAREASS